MTQTADLDSTGISQAQHQVRTVPLSAIAPHPANPRTDLGDLTELTASVREHGIIEPLVVMPAVAVAEVWPDQAMGLATAAWVLLAGHRRAAAAREAGVVDTLAVVREDLAGDRAGQLAAMAAENIAREALTPLEEAATFRQLAQEGWGQRRIAEACGCSQSHVSKRMKLLKLPAALVEAVGIGELPVADALTLEGLPDHGQMLAAWKAFGDPQNYRARTVADAVDEQRRLAEQAAIRQALLAQAEAEGLEVVEPPVRFGADYWSHQLHNAQAVKAAREKGTLVAAIPSWLRPETTLDYYSTIKPKRGTNRTEIEERTAVAERERTRAMKTRAQAGAALVTGQRMPTGQQLIDLLADAAINGSDSDARKLAFGWLREAGMAGADQCQDSYAWIRALLADLTPNPRTDRQRAAVALDLAGKEAHARMGHSSRWSARDAAHLQRLVDEVGYEPTEWEAARAAEAHRPGCADYHDGTCPPPEVAGAPDEPEETP